MTDLDTLRQTILDHAGQVYDATVELHDNVHIANAQPAVRLPRWKELTKCQRQRFVRDTAEAMGDLHAATLTISSETA